MCAETWVLVLVRVAVVLVLVLAVMWVQQLRHALVRPTHRMMMTVCVPQCVPPC
jgi:hypothetical protein